jgi:hypothetical protein
MKLTVVDAAKRDGELVAYSAAECTRLGKGEVVRVCGARPQTRQACRSTNFRWFLSRRRTVLPKGPTPQRDPFAMVVGAFH